MDMSLKVASPLTAATTNVPDNVPLPGLLLIANVILSVAVGTRFPCASCTWTLIAGAIGVVDTALVGSTLRANWVGVPGSTVKLFDMPLAVADVSVAVIVKLPVFDIVTLCDANTPLVKATVVPPPADRFPVEVMSAVPLKLVTVLLRLSRAVS